MNSDCKLLRGDCLDVLKGVESGSVDMVLADLPYGTTACKWDTRIPFEPLWKELHRVCKHNAAMAMFGSEPFSSLMRMSNLKRFKYDWIWDKKVSGSFSRAKFCPLKNHETISVFSFGNKHPRYFPQMEKRDTPQRMGGNKTAPCFPGASSVLESSARKYDNKIYTERFPSSIVYFSPRADKERGLHPTQKPIALLEYLIKTYTNEGDTVLDPTMGSGSTGVACKNLGRKFIGIEMDANYFAIAKRRIEDCNLQGEFK